VALISALALPLTSHLMGNYHDLDVWKKSVDLVVNIYSVTKTFPRDEVFGLRLQMRRAAASVPSNIAEGQGRSTDKEYRNFLFYARGSLLELETQIIIAERLSFLSGDVCDALRAQTVEIGKMLNGLLRYLRPDA